MSAQQMTNQKEVQSNNNTMNDEIRREWEKKETEMKNYDLYSMD